MIFLSARNEAEYYALETLHEMSGVVADEDVLFASGPFGLDNKKGKQFKLKVLFHSENGSPNMTNRPSLRFEGDCLRVSGEMLSSIVKWLGGEGLWETSLREGDAREKDAMGADNKMDRHTPYLDEMVEGFRDGLTNTLHQRGIPYRLMKPWDRPVICLTHDADSIRGQSLLRYAFWILSACRTLKPMALKETLKKIRKAATAYFDPHFSFEFIQDIEDRYGFRSTFFLMSLGFFLGREGRRYSVRHPGLKQALEKLAYDGFEIGLHPTGDAYRNPLAMKRQIARLQSLFNKPSATKGVRNHYLRFLVPDTWRINEDLGILYDTTWGWSDRFGFRAGTSRPFRPFDQDRQRRMEVWELPLIVMDGALEKDDSPMETIKDLSEKCFSHGGVFTSLWHTNLVSLAETPRLHQCFVSTLEGLANRNCTGLTCLAAIQKYREYSAWMEKNRRRWTSGVNG